MNFLNFSNLNDRPVLKYIVIAAVVINAIILAMLVFGSRFFPSKASGDSENASASPGYTVGWSGYSGTAKGADEEDEDEEAEEREDSDDADLSSTSATSEVAAEGEMPASGPLLELTDDHVTLKVGDYFNFYDYIKTMRDRDGSELSRYIHLTGQVNSYVPGDYLITYRITSQVDGESASADLLVTVEP